MKFNITQTFPTVESYLSQFLKVSKKNIHTIRMHNHHNKETIKINSNEAELNSPLKAGDILKINIDLVTSKYRENSTVSISKEFEDEYLLVVSKPFGIKTHPNDVELEDNTLVNYLISDYNYLEPIHRLDTDTCGLVILAKTPLIKAKLDQMLEQRQIKRYYSALIKNNIKPQTINSNIGRDSKEKNKMAVTRNGKNAITNILDCVKIDQNKFLVTVSLETGRTHQIRVHLAYNGVAIIGDKLYSKDGYKYDKMYLGALKVEFPHPVTEHTIEIKSSLEKEFLL